MPKRLRTIAMKNCDKFPCSHINKDINKETITITILSPQKFFGLKKQKNQVPWLCWSIGLCGGPIPLCRDLIPTPFM